MKEGWWDGFRVWEVKPWDGGFWFRGFGLLWARVMCWKRERDDEVERERSERDGRWNGHGGCKVGREDSRVWEW